MKKIFTFLLLTSIIFCGCNNSKDLESKQTATTFIEEATTQTTPNITNEPTPTATLLASPTSTPTAVLNETPQPDPIFGYTNLPTPPNDVNIYGTGTGELCANAGYEKIVAEAKIPQIIEKIKNESLKNKKDNIREIASIIEKSQTNWTEFEPYDTDLYTSIALSIEEWGTNYSLMRSSQYSLAYTDRLEKLESIYLFIIGQYPYEAPYMHEEMSSLNADELYEKAKEYRDGLPALINKLDLFATPNRRKAPICEEIKKWHMNYINYFEEDFEYTWKCYEPFKELFDDFEKAKAYEYAFYYKMHYFQLDDFYEILNGHSSLLKG